MCFGTGGWLKLPPQRHNESCFLICVRLRNAWVGSATMRFRLLLTIWAFSPQEVLEMEARMSGQDVAFDGYEDDEQDSSYAPVHYLEDKVI